MTKQLPVQTHIYQNHHLDSTYWQHYLPRSGDVVVSTGIKSGTTWVQAIIIHLIFHNQPIPALWDVSPWLDARLVPIENSIRLLEAQQHRRLIKSHLPLDAIPFYPQVNYIVVGRDPRDVFMSLWNHYSNYTWDALAMLNHTPGRVGRPLPFPPWNLHLFWQKWITQGWFEWECEGYPFWGNMRHTQTWWEFRSLENILFVHYNDLLHDLPAETRRIASFLKIPSTEEMIAEISQAVSLSQMRQSPQSVNPAAHLIWKGGKDTFFFKGTNGRWQGVLSDEELAQYEATANHVLADECRCWLQEGRLALAAHP